MASGSWIKVDLYYGIASKSIVCFFSN